MLEERQIDLGRDVVDNVVMSGREEVGDNEVDKQGRGRQQSRLSSRGLGVGTTMGRLKSERLFWFRVFFSSYITVQNVIVLH